MPSHNTRGIHANQEARAHAGAHAACAQTRATRGARGRHAVCPCPATPHAPLRPQPPQPQQQHTGNNCNHRKRVSHRNNRSNIRNSNNNTSSNRNISKRVLPELLRDYHVLPMDDYPMQLFDTLSSISPRPKDFPEVVVLTPGIYNSAYFEHAFLAQRMGAELVEGQDLVVGEDDCVYMKNVEGLSRVDVIYRRIDDLFIDPEAFHPDSVLGCRGLMRAWKKGNVALANAPGAGVADDKVVYNYVPDMIRYYLSEEPKLPNVPSFMCTDPKQLQHVLQNLESLVVKPANESGGYGLYIGPKATKRQTSEVKRLIKANPREFIAQPVINLSTVPTFCSNQIEPRHVDLRPFILQGNKSYVTEGGLSRVALVKGSLVVNSSQGGGSKDTWIIDNRRDIAKGGE